MSFEKWVAKYVKENDNIDYDLILLEDMMASWNASRIDTLKEIQAKLKVPIEFEWEETVEEWIDTELEKLK